ncbi:MAG: serine/threonine-protein kinase [Polyangiaceae bacterium]
MHDRGGPFSRAAGSFVVTSTPSTDETLRSADDDSAGTIVAPSDLPDPIEASPRPEERYRATGMLGAGGMGEVYLMRDQLIGREVALKSLRYELATSGQSRGRFLREIRVQGQLEHPAIVPVYDLGTREGTPWFTMRRVRGSTLSDVVQGLRQGDVELSRRFTRRRLLSAFSQICMAVHYAHTRGVVHRDLKPSNIMLGEFSEVYVLDWGVARVISAPDTGDAVAIEDDPSDARGLVGTIAYMSPEQARNETADIQSDVYSLGAILFEVLALGPLVDIREPRKALSALRSGTIVRSPAARAPKADVPVELDSIVLRATAPLRTERYASAAELAEAVERYLDGDRDLARRSELASDFAAKASTLADVATDAQSDAEVAHGSRMRGLAEVLRALALDANNAEAQRVLARLVLEASPSLPKDAEKERAAARDEQRAEGARLGLRAYLSFLLAAPLMIVAGIRASWVVACGILLILLGAWFARSAYRARRVGTTEFWVLLTTSTLLVIVQSTWLGPFVLTPVAATITASVFALYAERRERAFVIAAVLAMIGVPFALELVPGFPRGFEFVDGGVLLRPRALDLQPAVTVFALVYTTLGYGLLPAIFLFRLRDTLRGAEDRTFLQAWTLSRLLPALGIAANPSIKPPQPVQPAE